MITDEILKQETHPFSPFVPENATILILGSFPGMEQVKNKDNGKEWFYTPDGNLFWPILSEVFETNLETKDSKMNLFLKEGIAITDIYLKVRRKKLSNRDIYLIPDEYNDGAIKSILDNSKIKLILFTSKYVQEIFQERFPEIKNTDSLPSPSNAANIPISISEDYKNYKKENLTGDIKTFRVFKYKQLLKT